MSIASTGLSDHEKKHEKKREKKGARRTVRNFDDVEPLAVPPRVAWRLIGCGHDTGYKLLRDGKLRSFRRGRLRLIVVASIHELIEHEVAADTARPLDASLTVRRLSKRAAAAAAQETPTERAPPPRRTPRGRYAAKAAAE